MPSSIRPNQHGLVRQSIQAALNSRLMQRLTYPHGPNRFIELFDPTAVNDETIGTITDIDHPTERSVRVQVRPNARWQGLRAGQHVELSVEIDGRRHHRLFSPAHSEHATGALEFTMAVKPDGRVTRHLKHSARVGDRVVLGEAAGQFRLPDERPAHLVLISAGSGITPVLSMLRTLIDERYAGTVDFIHYAPSAGDELYGPALDRLEGALSGLHIHRVHTRNGGTHFSGEQLRNLVPDYALAQTFVCGPAALLDAARNMFHAEGLSERMHQEAFSVAPLAASDEAGGEIRFLRSERTTANAGNTLLEQAEQAGLSPTYGCRMGVCYACTCKKLQGRVRDLRTGEVSENGEQDIQICVSAPVGAVTLDL